MTIYHYVCHTCPQCEGVTDSILDAKSSVEWHRKKSGHDVEYLEVA